MILPKLALTALTLLFVADSSLDESAIDIKFIYEAKGYGCAMMFDHYADRAAALAHGILLGQYAECLSVRAFWDAM